MQQLADRALVQRDVEAGLDQRLQVDPPPAHHAVRLRVRAVVHDLFQLGQLLGREARLAPRPGPVVQAGEPVRVVAMHPVPQRLPVHPGRRAASRERPSSTDARASMRRAAAASRQRTASRRSSAALSSCRVTATVIRVSPAKP
jgi:hypothetical protein